MLKPNEGGTNKPIASFHTAHCFSLVWDAGVMVQIVDKDLAMPGEDCT